MYIVKVKDTNETVAICSRKEDAEAFVSAGSLDKKQYKIEIA
jgi:hypothetical protein